MFVGVFGILTLYITSTILTCGVIFVNSSCPYQKILKMIKIRSTESFNQSELDTGFNCNISPSACVKSRYRSIDGLCNNLNNPTWGAAEMPYARILPAKYGDGVSSFPNSITGSSLPNARKVRFNSFPDKVLDNMNYTLITMQWGQVVAHDMSLTLGVPQTKAQNLTCCDDDGNFNENAKTNPRCAPIHTSRNDPVYGPINKVCMDFVRTSTTRDKCTVPYTPVQQLSAVTAYLDISIVYGNNKSKEREVRALVGGRLKSVMRDGQEWPPQDPQPELTCDLLKTPMSPCYAAGDVRVNQNAQFTLLQVLLLREHNHIADVLAKLNPNWSDEIIFQEARRILIAICQRITYYQYLPIILGYDNMVKNKLIYPNASSYVNDYDPKINAAVFNEHATSAFRYFHTNIQGILKKYSENRTTVGNLRISDHMNNPTVLEQDDGFNTLARGLTVQSEAESDKYFDQEVSEYLFKAGNEFGDDLRAIDIQRSRDHGLPSYIDMRAACGLPVPVTFKDMYEYIPPEDVRILEKMYASVKDVDLLVGGSLETKSPNAQLGPTFLIISTSQFYKTRVGDRFFFENGGDYDIAFTSKQLQSIREGGTLARLLCDNVPELQSVQPDVFRKISNENQIVPCAELPRVNLTLWKE